MHQNISVSSRVTLVARKVSLYVTGRLDNQQQMTRFASVLPEVHHAGPMTTVCLSTKSDERYIVCGSTDTQLSVFDRQLNHRQALLVGHDAQVYFLNSLYPSRVTLHSCVHCTRRLNDRSVACWLWDYL